MRLNNILISIVIISLLMFTGCSTKSPNNPLDSRNDTLGEDTIPVFKVTRAVDSDSEEGQEHINFKWGEHKGELKYLDISIEYFDYHGTDTNGYPIYYIDPYSIYPPMRYKITIKNTSDRNFGHLEVIAIQEYYEDMLPSYRPWYSPVYVNIHKGDPLPGDAIQVWEDIYLGPYSEVVLEDTYRAPIQTSAGLDQTHVLIKHYNNGVLSAAVMYDNPELGVYCPPPPEN